MIKQTVTFEDFDGKEKTKDLYFHLTEAELTMLNLAENDIFNKYSDANDYSNELNIHLFEAIIEKAYGQKLEDGTFVKNKDKKEAFLCSPEYSALLMDMIQGKIDINAFILGCLPNKLSKQIKIGEDGKAIIANE